MGNKNATDPQQRGVAHRLGYRLALFAVWLLTGKRPANFSEIVFFDDHGYTDEASGGKKGYRGTTNMVWMAYIHAWVYHRLANDLMPGIVYDYRQRLLAAIRWQLQPGTSRWNGLMGNEQCSPAPHDTFYSGGAAVVHLAATLWHDSEMLDAINQWWAAYHGIAERCHTTTGEVVVPCVNARKPLPKLPGQEVWSAIYRARKGMMQSPRYTKKIRQAGGKRLLNMMTDDTYSLPLWVGLAERERGLASVIDLPAYDSIPGLRYGMDIYEAPGGYIARIPAANLDDVRETWKPAWVAHEVRVVGAEWTAKKLA